MESVIRGIQRPMLVNGVQVTDIESIIASLNTGEIVTIKLEAQQIPEIPKQETMWVETLTANDMRLNHTYLVKVQAYMTKPATPEFNFQSKWNNDNPMPFRVMQGRVLKETRGMLYMECHAVVRETDTCMRCGRPISHPVSRLYGLGPECGGHAHINPFDTKEELMDSLQSVQDKLAKIKWRGWIIKSAIEQVEEVQE